MASYGISNVRYDAQRVCLTEAKIHLYDGTLYFASSGWWKRDNVLRALRFNDQFVTLTAASGDKYQKAKEIHLVTIGGVTYLRIDNEQVPADDLGGLLEG